MNRFAFLALLLALAPQSPSRESEARAPIDAFFKAFNARDNDALKKTMRQHDEVKVHFEVVFSRYKADGTKYATYQSLWVSTRKDGRWGIQARSSFAP